MKSRKTVNNTSPSGRLSAASTARSELEEAVMSFPLDHLYACSSEQARSLRPASVVEQPRAPRPAPVVELSVTERISQVTRENQQLKELLLVNLDLVQQQSDRLVAKEKVLVALKRENAALKARIERLSRRPSVARTSVNPPPLVHIPASTPKSKPNPPATSQVSLNKYTELLITDIGPKATASPPADSEANKSQSLCYFPTEGEYLHLPEVNVAALLKENQNEANKSATYNFPKETDFLQLSEINMESLLKDNDPEISGAKGNGFATDGDTKSSSSTKKDSSRSADRIGAASSSTGSRSNISKHHKNEKPKSQIYKSRNVQPKMENTDNDYSHDIGKQFDCNFTVNKKSKMIHTYGKSSKKSSVKRLPPYTGSLSDRLKLIDTTPTGEDPYQLGELDLREQSPIPKLMLQKGTSKTKLFTGDNFTTSSNALNNLFNSPEKGNNLKTTPKIKSNKYNLGTPGYTYPEENDDESTDLSENSEAIGDVEKPLGDLAWPDFANKDDNMEVSCSDFSYGEKSRHLGSRMTFENDDYQNLFSSDSNFCPSDVLTEDIDLSLNDETASSKEPRKKNESSRSLLKPKLYGGSGSRKYVPLRERMKRTLSTGSAHSSKWSSSSKVAFDPKGENQRVIKRRASAAPAQAAGASGTKTPPPPITTDKPYYTTCGESDCAWYVGRDPDSDPEDEQLGAGSGSQYLEVPRWREKPYTSLYSLEGTENLDDEVFNKRHHKREVDERRRKRWDIQRIREQLHVERLRQKQPDAPWYDRLSGRARGDGDGPPHTLWPPARRSVRYLEIGESVPVSAFGDIIPALPEGDFVLPWILNTRPYKRSKYLKKPKIRESLEKELP